MFNPILLQPPTQPAIGPFGDIVAGEFKSVFLYPGVPNAYIDESSRITDDSPCRMGGL